jgi:hypothetical protein
MAVVKSGRAGSTGTDSLHKDEAVLAHYLDLSYISGQTALAGGAQAGTSLGDYAINHFATVASGNDSAQLPKALPGRIRVVINAAASNSMVVFPQSGEAINAIAADSGFTLAANKVAIFFCAVAGTWHSNLTA